MGPGSYMACHEAGFTLAVASAQQSPDDGRPESPEPTNRQRILLVTGMLGAGKTTALRELEDLGWEAIDNFPIRLLAG